MSLRFRRIQEDRKYPTGRKVEKVNVPSDAFSACYSRNEGKYTVVNEIENLRWINSEVGQKNTERGGIGSSDEYAMFKIPYETLCQVMV